MSTPFKMKGWSPFTKLEEKKTSSTELEEKKTISQQQKEEVEKQEYHTSGLPETIYKADGTSINTTTGEIDEGSFSAIKGGGDNKYVEALKDAENYKKGQKFYINKT